MNNSIIGVKQWRGLSFLYIWTFISILFIDRGSYLAEQIGFISIIIISLFLDSHSIIILLTAILPTGNVYKISGGYKILPFLIGIYLIKVLLKGKQNHATMIHKDTMISLLLIIVLLIIGYISSLVNNIGFSSVVAFYFHVLFVSIAIQEDECGDITVYDAVSKVFVISTLFVCLCSVLFTNAVHTLANISIYSKANPGFSSSWDFGRSICISISMIVVMLIRSHKHYFLGALVIGILLYFMIMSGRFSMLLGIAAMLLCIPFIVGKGKSLQVKVSLFVTYSIIIVLAGVLIVSYIYPAMTALRGYEVSDNGRFEVWATYFKFLENHVQVILFGVGGGAIGAIAPTLGVATAHNIFLEKIVEFGIFGIALLTILGINIYKGRNLSISTNESMIPLITFLGTAMTQGTTGILTFALLLIICARPKEVEEEI